MVTVQSFRQMALSLPGVIELPHFERTSFRVNLEGRKAVTRIIATMDEKKKIAVLMLSPLEQSVFCAFDNTIIYPVPGAWGRQGCTIFELAKVRKSMLQDALQVVYRDMLNKKKP
ncbi:MAG: MmcQ/YjbR family DNA-binding protein [Chitinophagaceae bacterium]|nr:MmcQ/YjbR family DNA-binding protein [Chitinophagaceae bacterium]